MPLSRLACLWTVPCSSMAFSLATASGQPNGILKKQQTRHSHIALGCGPKYSATLHWDAVRNIAFWLAIVIFLWSAMGCLHLHRQHRHHNRRHPQNHSRHYHNLLPPSSSLKQLQQRTYPYLGECHHRRLRKNLQSRMHGSCVTGSEIALV